MSASFWITSGLLVCIAAFATFALLKGNKDRLSDLPAGDRISLRVNSVLLVFTMVSILIALIALQDTRTSGDEQKKALQASRESLENVVSGLKVQTQLLNDAQNTLQSQLEVSRQQQKALTATTSLLQSTKTTLNSQLKIVDEQNKRELERLRQKPNIQFIFGNMSESAFAAGATLSAVDVNDLKLIVSNKGNAALVNPVLTISAQPNEVYVSGYGQPTGPQHKYLQIAMPIIDQSLEPSAQTQTDYLFNFRLSIPENISSVVLNFKIYGSNMALHQASLKLQIKKPDAEKK